MENLIFGLPCSTLLVITGIPALIIILLVLWGFFYKPDDWGNKKGGGE